MQKEYEYIISAREKGQRLDHFLAAKKELDLSRSQIQKFIKNKDVLLNNQPTKASYRIKRDDRLKVAVPLPKELEIKAENIPLDIVYEDDDLLVINKPKGIVVHPAPGNYSGTLVNALLYHTKNLSTLGSPQRPGIVHRLDKDTSGLLVVAKSDLAYRYLSQQIKKRTLERTYVALVEGVIKNDQGRIETLYGRHPVQRKKMAVLSSKSEVRGPRSREALTSYQVLRRFKNYTLVEVKIKTGRTHQIRVQMSYIGHPLVGDTTYGKKKEEFPVKGQLLHAQKIGFIHPQSEKYLEFAREMPEEMQQFIQKLNNEQQSP